MTGSPSSSDIVAALKQSGYLMEQQVATQLEALGMHVWTNWAFKDIDEGKSREMDIRAIKRVAHNEDKKISAFIEIIAECKNSSNPMVFIGRPKNVRDSFHAPEELVFPVQPYRKQRAIQGKGTQTQDKFAFFHLGFDKVHHAFAADTKAVQFCRIDRKGKGWHANHSGLYDSIFYPMAKALISRKQEIPTPRNSSDWRYFWFFVPIVVTSGDIYYVDSTSPDPVPVKRHRVTFMRDIRSGNLNGTFAIDFVCQDALENYYSDSLQPLINRMADLTTNEADFVLREQIPWSD